MTKTERKHLDVDHWVISSFSSPCRTPVSDTRFIQNPWLPEGGAQRMYRSVVQICLALLLKVWTHKKSISQDSPLLPLCQSQLNSVYLKKVYCSLSLKFIIQIQETRTWKPLMQCEFCVTMSTRHPNSQSKTSLKGHRSHLLNSKHPISLGSYKGRSASLNNM